MRTKKFLIFAIIIIALGFFLSLIIVLYTKKGKKVTNPSSVASPIETSQEENIAKERVTLFFPTMEGYLLKEEREIEKKDNPVDKIIVLLKELENPPGGAFSPFPPGGGARKAFIVGDEAVVDINLAAENFGSLYELLTIYSLVDSITYNVQEVKRVKIVIGGMERVTLFGHVSLKYSFYQDLSYAGE